MWENTIFFGGGAASDSVILARLALQHDLGYRFMESTTGVFGLALEGSADYWHDDDNDENDILALAPILSYTFHTEDSVIPYLEAGLGGAYISDITIGDNELGINFQFEVILGTGLKFGCDHRHSLSVRLIHYSNAELGNENDGMNCFFLSYGYSF